MRLAKQPSPLPQNAEGERHDQTDSIAALTERLREFRRARAWERFHTPRNLAVSIAIESGELLEQFQWIDDETKSSPDASRQEAIGEEIADVVIYAMQLSDVLGIPLGDAIDSKIETNAERYPADLARGSSRKYPELGVVSGHESRRSRD